MSRFALWSCWAISGFAYQAVKPLFGFTPNWVSYFDAMYWTGAALILLSIAERGKVIR